MVILPDPAGLKHLVEFSPSNTIVNKLAAPAINFVCAGVGGCLMSSRTGQRIQAFGFRRGITDGSLGINARQFLPGLGKVGFRCFPPRTSVNAGDFTRPRPHLVADRPATAGEILGQVSLRKWF